VTISCKATAETSQNLQIQLIFFSPLATQSQTGKKKALHVQSRSYWAPANIGPYSQAVAYPCTRSKPPQREQDFIPGHHESDTGSDDEDHESLPSTWLVKIAGQIPLIPASMALPVCLDDNKIDHFKSQAVLSLQHLWRIGVAMDVKWFPGAVAYIPSRLETSVQLNGSLCSKLVAKTWKLAHAIPAGDSTEFEDVDEDEHEPEVTDVWDQRNNRSGQAFNYNKKINSKPTFPDWSLVQGSASDGWESCLPQVFTAQIDTLPRDADVEWHAFTGIGAGATDIQVCI
jgi:diphthine-ammonia ligase